jgi:hypothetical protein
MTSMTCTVCSGRYCVGICTTCAWGATVACCWRRAALCGQPAPDLQTAIEPWRPGILDELAQRTRHFSPPVPRVGCFPPIPIVETAREYSGRGDKGMDDEQYLYRVQWRTLCRHLYQLCLGRYKPLLLDALSDGGPPYTPARVQAAVDAWRQAILTDLAQRTRAAGAWRGWAALLPLFGDTARLDRAIAQAAEQICDEYAQGKTRRLWQVLRTYFIEMRDHLDGAKPTRLQVWRQLDQRRQAYNRQRRQHGLPDCDDVAEVAAYLLASIECDPFKDAPRTVEGVLSYLFEFDSARTRPYDEELAGLDTLLELTGEAGPQGPWQLALAHGLDHLPADLRQAVEWRFTLRPRPVLSSDTAYQRYYGCSQRTLRDRADRGVQHLRALLGL